MTEDAKQEAAKTQFYAMLHAEIAVTDDILKAVYFQELAAVHYAHARRIMCLTEPCP